MAIKNLFGRGIGFTGGVVSWIVTRGYGLFVPAIGLPVQGPTSVVMASNVTAVSPLIAS